MSVIHKSMKGDSIINNINITNATVQNTLNISMFQQPVYSYGTFSSGSLIPLNFSTTSPFKYAEIKLNFKPSVTTNVFLSGNDTSNANVGIIEPLEIFYKTTNINGTTPNIKTSNTGNILITSGQESALTDISIINGLNKCHFKTDSVYTFASVGASRAFTSGYFPTTALGSIQINLVSGTFISATYSMIKYY